MGEGSSSDPSLIPDRGAAGCDDDPCVWHVIENLRPKPGIVTEKVFSDQVVEA